MKQLQKLSKFLSDYTSIVVIAIAVITFFLPSLMGWVNFQLFTDPVANKFTGQSIIIGVIMFSMGLTLTTEDFKILAQRPFDICILERISVIENAPAHTNRRLSEPFCSKTALFSSTNFGEVYLFKIYYSPLR